MLGKAIKYGKVALCALCAGLGVVSTLIGGVGAIAILGDGNVTVGKQTDEE